MSFVFYKTNVKQVKREVLRTYIYIAVFTSCVLGLGVFGFVDVTFESKDTAGPSAATAAAAFICAKLRLLLLLDELDEPFPTPGTEWPPPALPRLGGVLFFRVFGDFNEILKFSDVCRPLPKGNSGPCCWHTERGRIIRIYTDLIEEFLLKTYCLTAAQIVVYAI